MVGEESYPILSHGILSHSMLSLNTVGYSVWWVKSPIQSYPIGYYPVQFNVIFEDCGIFCVVSEGSYPMVSYPIQSNDIFEDCDVFCMVGEQSYPILSHSRISSWESKKHVQTESYPIQSSKS